jgi:hypothetical protein
MEYHISYRLRSLPARLLPVRSLPALGLLAASTLGLYCPGASAASQPDIRPLLEAAPSVHFVYYKAPAMSLMTPAMAGGANLITAGTKSSQLPEGGELEKAYEIPNASGEIASQLLARLKSGSLASKLHVQDHPQERPWSSDPGLYHGETQDPFVLELVVDGHGAAYMPFNWKTYYFGITARLRLIDVAQSKVVWEHRCNQSGLHGSTYKLKVEEFEANGGARLKEVEQAANDFCARELGDLVDPPLGR